MQTINFIQAVPGRKVILPAQLVFILFAGLIFILSFISIGMEIVSILRSNEYHRVMQEQQTVAQEFLTLAQQYPLIAGEVSIEDKVTKITRQLAAKKALWEALSHISLKVGFSGYLTDLAREVPKGIWLTEIKVNQRVGKITLSGGGVRASLIPRLMSALKDTPYFKDKLLNIFSLTKQEKTGVMRFTLSNKSLLEKPTGLTIEVDKNTPLPSNKAEQLFTKVIEGNNQ